MYQYFEQINTRKTIIIFILAQILGSGMAVGMVELMPMLAKYPDAGFEILRGGPSILLILWFLYDMKKKKISLHKDFSRIRAQIDLPVFSAILLFNILIGLFSVYALIYCVVNFFPVSTLDNITQSNGLAQQKTLIGTIVGSVVAVFLAPLSEEFIFRGFLFAKLKKKFSHWTGIIASSILFGAIHFSLSAITTFLFALSLSIIVYKTKNLAIAIIFHIFNNLVVSIVSIYNELVVTSVNEDLSINGISSQFYTIALPCLIISTILACYLIKKRHLLNLEAPLIRG